MPPQFRGGRYVTVFLECRISPQLTIPSPTTRGRLDYKWPYREENRTVIYFQTVVKSAYSSLDMFFIS